MQSMNRLCGVEEGMLLFDIIMWEEERCNELLEQCERCDYSCQDVVRLLEHELDFIDQNRNVKLKCDLYLRLVEAYKQLPHSSQKIIALLGPRVDFIYKLVELEKRMLLCTYLMEAYNAEGMFDSTVQCFEEEGHCRSQFKSETMIWQDYERCVSLKMLFCIQAAVAYNQASKYEGTIKCLAYRIHMICLKCCSDNRMFLNQLKLYISLALAYACLGGHDETIIKLLEPQFAIMDEKGNDFSHEVLVYQVQLSLLLAQAYNNLGRYQDTLQLLTGRLGHIVCYQLTDQDIEETWWMKLLDQAMGVHGKMRGINGRIGGINGKVGANGTMIGINGKTVGVNGTTIGVNGKTVGVNGTMIGANGKVGVNGKTVGGNGKVGVNGKRKPVVRNGFCDPNQLKKPRVT